MKVRELNKNDELKLKEFFIGLSDKTIYHWNRFNDVRDINLAEKTAKEQISKPKKEERGFVAVKDNGEIMGYSYLRYFPDKLQKRYNASLGIVVSDKFQGRGAGRELMEYMVKTAGDQGMKKIWLTVYADNEKAVKFYQKYDFEIEGLFMYDEYFGAKPRHILSMALFLDKDLKKSKQERKKIIEELL